MTKNTVAMENLEFLSGQQGNVVEEPGYKYHIVQWLNGQKSLAALGKNHPMYTGGFFFKTKQDDSFPLGEEMVYTFHNGDEEEVRAIGGADVIVMASRLHWYENDPAGGRRWLKGYKKGAKGRNQFLLIFRGAEEWHEKNGPLMLSVYGVNGLLMARAYEDFRTKVHAVAEELSAAAGGPPRLDAYTFYMRIVPGDFEKASQNFDTLITPPKLDLSGYDKKNPAPYLNEVAVPKRFRDENGFLTAIWDECQEWAREEPFGTYEQDMAIDDGDNAGADVNVDNSNEYEIGDILNKDE